MSADDEKYSYRLQFDIVCEDGTHRTYSTGGGTIDGGTFSNDICNFLRHLELGWNECSSERDFDEQLELGLGFYYDDLMVRISKNEDAAAAGDEQESPRGLAAERQRDGLTPEP